MSGRATDSDIATDLFARDGGNIICPQGAMTVKVAEPLRQVLLRNLREEEADVCFDFGSVTDIDAAVLGVFVVFSKMVSQVDLAVKLQVINMNPEIRVMWHDTGLVDFFPIADDP